MNHTAPTACTDRRLLVVTALSTLLGVGTASAANLSIDLSGIRDTNGQLMVSVVDSAAAWNNQAKPVRATATAIHGNTAQIQFADLPPGNYAVMVMHDENGNGKLDTNAIGMPVEGYGFSNNPRVMRKPTFEEARFTLPANGAHIDIALR